MLKIYAEIIADFSNIILGLNIIIYSIRCRSKTLAYKIFIFYLIFSLIIQLWSSYLASRYENNLYLSHYYFTGQLAILSLFYYKLLKSNLKKIIPFLGTFVFVILGFSFFFKPELYNQFFLFEIVLSSLPVVLYSLFYFFESFGDENKKFLIINSGVFIYLLCSTIIFSSGNLINGLISDSTSIMLWFINIILYLIYQILIFIEWYKNFRIKL